MKKQVKVDPETRSYDIRTKTHQKILTIPNMAILWTTLRNGMIIFVLEQNNIPGIFKFLEKKHFGEKIYLSEIPRLFKEYFILKNKYTISILQEMFI